MATDYERFYRENPHGLGEPTREFLAFFDSFDVSNANVLDVGCGQGRDALFIGRLGHSVVAIDQSSTGIRDLLRDARREDLAIVGKVADIREFDWGGPYDVVVIDRTLHMLPNEESTRVIRDLMHATRSGSYLLIADERKSLPAFQAELDASDWQWSTVLARRGFLFVKRE